MTPHEFIAKWRNGGDERRDFQSFFDDLCRLMILRRLFELNQQRAGR